MESLEEAARDLLLVLQEKSDGVWLGFESSRGQPLPHLIEYVVRNASGKDRELVDKVVQNLPDPRQYLMIHQQKLPGATFLAQHGTEFPTKDWGENHEFLAPGRCYQNSLGLRLNNSELQYAEGICVCPSGVEYHAWNIKDGYVYDRTYPMSHYSRYFGTTLEPHWLAKTKFPYGCLWARWRQAEKDLKELFAGHIT